MKKVKRFLVLFMMSWVIPALLFCVKSEKIEKITILHWNDFHAATLPYYVSQDAESTLVSGSACFSAYLDTLKKKNGNVFLVCAGDEVVGTPVSTLSKGKVEFEILNLIRPDVFGLGNHEFDFGLENLKELIQISEFPIICANVMEEKTDQTLVPPYRSFKKGKAKIAFIGLNTETLKEVVVEEGTKGLQVKKAKETLEQYLPKLEKVTDIQVVVSHMGFEADKKIAQEVDGIEVIIGGHSHTKLFEPKVVNQTIICQAGSNGRYIGELDLVIDLEKNKIINYEGGLIETVNEKVTPDPAVQGKVDEFEKTYGKILDEVIGELKTPWRRNEGESNLGNWNADVMRAHTQSDVAFINSGALRKNLDPGPIRVRDIWEINPFSDHFVSFHLTGSQLLKALELNSSGDYELMQVSGLKYIYDPEKPKGEKIIQVLVRNKKLMAEERYKVTINDYMLDQSDKFLGISKTQLKYKIYPELDRNVYIQAIRDQKVIHSEIEGRIKRKK
jgi:2',3'-cyclic-nucleotide 2'-phosphodiesterase (5'-nucleotidase family)